MALHISYAYIYHTICRISPQPKIPVSFQENKINKLAWRTNNLYQENNILIFLKTRRFILFFLEGEKNVWL